MFHDFPSPKTLPPTPARFPSGFFQHDMPWGRPVALSLVSAFALFATACGAPETPSSISTPPAPDRLVIRVLVEVGADHRAAFQAHLTQEAAVVRQMDGCLRFDLFADPTDEGRFLLYEEWRDGAAFEAYKATDTFTESFRLLGPMMTAPPDSAYFDAFERES